ncbi:MAG: PTS glucitol/sorbitol transporter subunit IIA [Dorea sp.]|nr:PTS glucitol/sorbitol transporter subunit IIA [Dorea sp.]
MFILFGDSAPDEIKDFCYSVSVNPINGEIKKGQILKIDDKEYPITAVGHEAPVTLAGLGHCTINMNGADEAALPGTIHVGPAEIPEIVAGTVIQIIEK